MKKKSVFHLTLTAIFGALSAVLYIFVKIPLPTVFPFFLELNFSAIPIILAGFIVGPIYGSILVVIRFFAKILFMGFQTNSFFVGEIVDVVIGISVVLVTSILYNILLKKKDGFVSSLSCGLVIVPSGIITWTLIAVLANYLFIVRMYITVFFNGNVDGFVGMLNGTGLFQNLTNDNYMGVYLLYACLPFNLLLSTIVMVFTYIIYRPLDHFFIRKMDYSS